MLKKNKYSRVIYYAYIQYKMNMLYAIREMYIYIYIYSSDTFIHISIET